MSTINVNTLRTAAGASPVLVSEIAKLTDVNAVRADLAAPTGSGLVGYMPAGAGAVATTVNAALNSIPYVNVLNFFADGISGVKVDPLGGIRSDQGIQAAIVYARSVGAAVLLPGKFRLEAPLKYLTGTQLIGIGMLYTELKAYHAGNIIEMTDDDSVFCNTENMRLNGNSQANSGILFKRTTTQYGVPGFPILYDITHSKLKDIYVSNCVSHGITVGVDGTGAVMELNFDGILAEANGGYGIYFTGRTTDGAFNNLVARVNAGGGIYYSGTNCRFSNCKAYWSGTALLPKPGYYITGARSAFVNMEAQDNFGHGFQIVSATNHEMTNLIADCNGNYDGGITPPVTPAYDGIFIQNSINLNIKMTALDWRYVDIGGYTQRSGINIDGNSNNNINVIANFASSSKQDLICAGSSININITKVGSVIKRIGILPATATVNGVTYTKFSDSILGMKGTASADSTHQLYGAFGDPVNFRIPFKAGQKIKVSLSEQVISATLFVIVNASTVLAATTSNRVFVAAADGYINNIYVKILNGVNIGEIMVSPEIVIFD